MRTLLLIVVLVVLVVVPVWAQEPPEGLRFEEREVLSEVLRLEEQVLLRDIEIAVLRRQAAEVEFVRTEDALNDRLFVFQAKVVAETEQPEGTIYNMMTGQFMAPPEPAEEGDSP